MGLNRKNFLFDSLDTLDTRRAHGLLRALLSNALVTACDVEPLEELGAVAWAMLPRWQALRAVHVLREHADASALLMLRSVPLEGLQFDVRRLEAALHEVELAHRFADDVERKRA